MDVSSVSSVPRITFIHMHMHMHIMHTRSLLFIDTNIFRERHNSMAYIYKTRNRLAQRLVFVGIVNVVLHDADDADDIAAAADDDDKMMLLYKFLCCREKLNFFASKNNSVDLF